MPYRRSWKNEQLISAVSTSDSLAQVIKKLGLIPAGGNYTQIKKYIKEYHLDTGHFLGKRARLGKAIPRKNVYSLKQILVKNSNFQSHKLKWRLVREGVKKAICEECGWAKKSIYGRMPLELDHINGNSKDNRIDNLRILCPNCHSLKPTHRGSNRKKKRG